MAPTQTVSSKIIIALIIAVLPVVGGSITSVVQLSGVITAQAVQGNDIKDLKREISAMREDMARFQERQDANTKGRSDHEGRIRTLEGRRP